MQTGSLRSLAGVVTVMVALEALYLPSLLITQTVAPELVQTSIVPIINELDVAVMIFRIATMIVFSVWIHVAGRNLVNAGFDDLEFTPGSRIWWFAIPIANLFKPYQGMRELWNASHGSNAYTEGNALIGVWWALWLGSGLISQIAFRMGDASTPGLFWAESAADLALAAVAIALVRGITQAQERLTDEALAEVFA